MLQKEILFIVVEVMTNKMLKESLIIHLSTPVWNDVWS